MKGPEGEGGGGGYVEAVLRQHPAMFAKLLVNAPCFRFQVLLSHLVSDPHGCPRLVRHGYRVDEEYFYPASAIKLCAAVSAVGKLKQLESSLGTNVNCTTPLALYSLFEGAEDDRTDPSNVNEKHITVAHEVRKIFLVSDNKAFNRLFSFVGHRTINQAMWDLGLQSTRLHHRLSEVRSSGDNLYSEPFDLKVAGVALTWPPKYSRLIVQDNSGLPGAKVGSAFITDEHHLVPEPMDFSMKNYMSLVDQQNLLMKLVRPDVEGINKLLLKGFCTAHWSGTVVKLGTPGINMDEAMRMLLMEAMAQYPSQSANPHYDQSAYPDDYCKFFLPGLSRVRPKKALRIYNKIGRAYGFTVDNSYVFDIETGRSFFLTAVLYTNANGVLNDDRYEYDFADRTMADLAEVLARALWQIPYASATLSSPFDCTPSSLWAACTLPLTTTHAPCENDTEQSVGLESSEKADKRDVIGENSVEGTFDLATEKQSPILQQSLKQIASELASPDLTTLRQPNSQWGGSSCGPTVNASMLCGLLSKSAYSTVEPVGSDLPPNLGGRDLKSAVRMVALPSMTQPPANALALPDSSVEDPRARNSRKDNIKPCYRFFVDE